MEENSFTATASIIHGYYVVIRLGFSTPFFGYSMKISVIIVNFNAGQRLGRCLKALAAQDFDDFEALVVDNASTDGSPQTPLPDPRFRWLKPGENLGFAGGNNLAARAAQGDWLFLLNPDAYAEPECLSTLMAATRRHPDCPLFGCTQLDDAVPEILDGAGDCYFFTGLPFRGGKGWTIEALPDEGEVFGICGAALLTRRELFLRVGGFDEDFFCYCEDTDLAFRLRLQGYRAIQVAEAFVRHEGSGITGRRSAFALFHGTRNLVWTFVKNMPGPLFWPILPLHLAMLFFLILLSPAAAASRFRGFMAALESLSRVWEKRQKIQPARTASVPAIARALTWSPRKLLWRMVDVRSLTKSRK